ncbi:MAG: hypothetical protein ABIV13_05555 [Fimbriimonadales bacterium]
MYKTLPKKKQRPKVRLPFGAAALVGIAIAIAWFFWPIGVDDVAMKSLQAARSGDGATLYKHSFEDQIRSAGLTEDMLAKVWQVSVIPRLVNYKEISEPTVEVSADSSRATASVVMKNAEGHQLKLQSQAFATDSGPKISPMNFVTAMWTQEYVVERGKPVTELSALQASVEGLSHDRTELEAAGLLGFPSKDGDESFVTWDQAMASWQQTIKSLRAQY